ncbi:transmembrane fragile-X-F-associated protein, partial [Trifolium medium]|nr:transmembrane fragile-X-F-associated protein [Trifolium medium]
MLTDFYYRLVNVLQYLCAFRGFPAVDLKIVFLPLLTFEVIILIDNFRMCKALMPGDEESMSDEAIWETLPHFWVAISMVFFVAATVFTLLKLS